VPAAIRHGTALKIDRTAVQAERRQRRAVHLDIPIWRRPFKALFAVNLPQILPPYHISGRDRQDFD
jgi:hypothetical protein